MPANTSKLSQKIAERLEKALDKQEKAQKEVEMWEALLEIANRDQKKLA